MARRGLLIGGLGAVAVLLSHGARHVATALLQQGRVQALGEDADWDVKHWSVKHVHAVGSSAVDKTSIRNIWHSSDQAWAGIDSVLPTGGRFGYEEDHVHTADQAGMLQYLGYAQGQLKTMAEALPKAAPAGLNKELAQARLTIQSEEATLAAVEHQMEGGGGAFKGAASKALPEMLSQAPQGRVYADEALYGEGIVGDIKSQGHHERHWNAKGAQKDMQAYFSSLGAKLAHKAAAAHGGRGLFAASDQNMDDYFASLAREGTAQRAMHDATLKADHYYQMHPFEHRDMKKFIRDSFAGKAQAYNSVYIRERAAGKAAPTEQAARGEGEGARGERRQAHVKLQGAVAGLPEEIKRVWVAHHGIPKTAEQARAFEAFAGRAVRVAQEAAGAAVARLA